MAHILSVSLNKPAFTKEQQSFQDTKLHYKNQSLTYIPAPQKTEIWG